MLAFVEPMKVESRVEGSYSAAVDLRISTSLLFLAVVGSCYSSSVGVAVVGGIELPMRNTFCRSFSSCNSMAAVI